MKVILTAEVKGKGHEGDIVDVARGYAVNYLLPRKMAVEATAGAIKQLQARMNNISKRNATRLTGAQEIAAALEGKAVIIEAKAGQDGKLFGSVTTLMIEQAIAAQLGPDVDHKRMNLHRPIKTAGDHEVVVNVFGDVKATVIVRVVAEGTAADVAAEAAATPEPEAVEPEVVEEAEVEAAEPATEDVEEATEEAAEESEGE